ncbi:MAG: iron-containing alcohol dehydrogenase [Bacillota bacterium]|nr:iron-containing alcohol dehydrogenase [Bacillota bacterium]
MLFDFLVPQRIIFGPGTSGRLGEEASRLGRRLLLVTGRRGLQASGMLDRILNPLSTAKLDIIVFNEVPPEPTLEVVEAGLEKARGAKVDLIIGAGGGSVLDVAKAISGLYACPGSVKEYFEGRPVEVQGLPWIAVATTSGSGSEVTRNAVLADAATCRKQSIRCDSWTASVALVDPVLAMSMPPALTALTGMDALTHALEAYTSRWSHPLTDALALEAAVLLCRNLYTAYRHGNNREVREKMALGSLLAGIALNNARPGAVHGLAHPVGIRYRVPHGLVCAILLPYVMEYNLIFGEEKYAKIAKALGLVEPETPATAAARRLLSFVIALRERLKIPAKLKDVGLSREDLPFLVEAALPSGSLAANPRAAGYADLMKILETNL